MNHAQDPWDGTARAMIRARATARATVGRRVLDCPRPTEVSVEEGGEPGSAAAAFVRGGRHDGGSPAEASSAMSVATELHVPCGPDDEHTFTSLPYIWLGDL